MIDKPKIKGDSWRNDLDKYGIKYLSDRKEIFNLIDSRNILLCTRCSKTKGRSGDKEIPRNFYKSRQNLRFYRWCESNNYKYGILSDLYGLHMYNERLAFYDIHPSGLSKIQFKILGKKIKNKMSKYKFESFLYYNSSPIMSIPYFYMMLFTGFDIFYIAKLPYESKIRRFGK